MDKFKQAYESLIFESSPFTHKIKTMVEDTDKNYEICNSVIGQLSDGIWENTPSMEKYWNGLYVDREGGYLTISVADGRNPLYFKDSTEVLEWFANKIKQIVKIFFENNGYASKDWSRTNQTTVAYLGHREKIAVADAYYVYDLLKGRNAKGNAEREQRKIQLKIEELEAQKAKEIAEIEAKYARLIEDAKNA